METDDKEIIDIVPDKVEVKKQEQVFTEIQDITAPTQSPNFIYGVTGWRLNSNGIIDAVGVNLVGSVTITNTIIHASQHAVGGTDPVFPADPGADKYLKWNNTSNQIEWADAGGGTIDGSGTSNEITYWVDSNTLGSLAVATYPSLTELSYVKGVTSAIQTQLGTKAPTTAPTFATSITGSYLTASEILITDGSKNIVSAPVATYPSLTELSYVKGLSSAVQTQINAKAPTASPTFTGEVTIPNTGLHLLDTNASHDLIIKPGSDLSADRTLTLTTGNTDMIVDFTAVTDEYVLAYDTATNTWRGVAGGAGGGATTALDNLASVAINTSLISDTDSTDDLGSSAKYWANTYTDKIYLNGTATLDGTVAGFATLTGGLTVSDDFAVDTSVLFVDVSANRIGINTTTPSVPLEIISEEAGLQVAYRNFASSNSGAVMRVYKGRGTYATPLRTRSGDTLGGVNAFGYYAADDSTTATVGTVGGQFLFITQEAWTSTGQGTLFRVGTTPTGSTTMATALFITGEKNLLLGAGATVVSRGTTVGTNHLDIFNGTAPVGTLTNGISIYSSSGVGYLMQADGTGGAILTTAGGTMAGDITLGENTSVALDPAGSADGKYSGITVTGTAGAALAFGDLIYLDPTDSRWELADANSAAAADGDARGILGICVLAAAGDGSATKILLHGIVRADTAFPSFTINNPIYVSETAGDVTQTQPTTTDVVIRIVGSALTADEMYFSPDWTWTTHT